MDLAQLFPFLLFLHAFGAILAFGPTFAFAIMGSMAGKEPQHANFSTRQAELISKRLVYPLAILQGITGVLLIITGKLDVTSRVWLEVAIVLYVITLTFALTIQRRAVEKVIELTSTPPPPGTPPGPPPALMAAVMQVRRGGMFTGPMIAIIVFLMVVKPTF